ncbi:hypothetical protein J6590_078754 [Homalodisca vitripennis]|nr:hypothetical protein J6590_078754 [Homalodisca vitripennis]
MQLLNLKVILITAPRRATTEGTGCEAQRQDQDLHIIFKSHSNRSTSENYRTRNTMGGSERGPGPGPTASC